MTVEEFEKAVLETEEVVIKVRAGSKETVQDYPFQRQASGGTSVSDWLATRITPLIGDFEVSIIDGNYVRPHGRTTMRRLRESYER